MWKAVTIYGQCAIAFNSRLLNGFIMRIIWTTSEWTWWKYNFLALHVFLQNVPKNWVLLRRTEPEIHFGDYYFYIIDVICIFVISLNPDLTTPLGLILKRFLFAFLKFFNQVILVNLNKIYKKKTLKFTDDNEIDFWRVSSESVFFRHEELHEIILDLSL